MQAATAAEPSPDRNVRQPPSEQHDAHAARADGPTAATHETALVPAGQEEATEALRDNSVTPPCEQAIFRIDFPRWLRTLGRRDRRLALDLMRGERTLEAASKRRISPARVSQLRRNFCRDWQVFCGELPVARTPSRQTLWEPPGASQSDSWACPGAFRRPRPLHILSLTLSGDWTFISHPKRATTRWRPTTPRRSWQCTGRPSSLSWIGAGRRPS